VILTAAAAVLISGGCTHSHPLTTHLFKNG